MNLDETGFDLVNGLKGLKVGIVTQKYRRLYHQTSADRTHHSAAVCVRGDGFLYKVMYATKSGGKKEDYLLPDGAALVLNDKGYFDDAAFKEFVLFLLLQIPDDGKARLLIMDGYGSHTMCPSILNLFKERNVHCVCMPSHTSQALQPLDVSCFGPTKQYWRVDLGRVNRKFGVRAANKFTVAAFFQLALEDGCSEKNIQSGFRTCGVWPFNSSWAADNKHLFTLAEDLDAQKRKRKVELMKPTIMPMDTVVSQLKKCRSACEAAVRGEGLEGVPEELVSSIKTTCSLINETVLPVAERLNEIFPMPYVEEGSAARGPKKLNRIGESFCSAKLLTHFERIKKLEEQGQKAVNANNAKAEAKKLLQAERAQKEAAAKTKRDEQLAISELLHRHGALRNNKLTKAALVAFYRTNKQTIDTLTAIPVPQKNLNLAFLVRLFTEHNIATRM